MKTKELICPDLNDLCRLCLKENSGTIFIFDSTDNSNKALSIPIRIMSCAALEVQINDGLPSNICEECRIQLEKSYYFRKKCQLSDSKLRKHFRLINAGKQSKVFMNDDDDEDELEFEDSLNFLKSVDEIQKLQERTKWEDEYREKIQLEEKQKFEKEYLEKEQRFRKALRVEEMKKTESLRIKASQEVKEIHLNLQASMKSERAKLEQRISNEYRNRETEILLDELNQFIINKRQTIEQNASDNRVLSPVSTLSPVKNINISLLEENCNNSNEKLPEHYVIYNSDNFSVSENELEDFLVYDKNDKNSQQQIDEDQKSDDFSIESVNQYIVCNDEFDIVDQNQNENCDNENSENEEKLEEIYPEENEDSSIKSEYYENNDVEMLFDNEFENDQFDNEDEAAKEKKIQLTPDKLKNPLTSHESNRRIVKIEMVGKTRIAIEQSSRYSVDDLKTFRCTECSQAFTKKSKLESHKKAHEKSSGYYCEQCSKWFTCKSSLDRHSRIHTGEKPFKCEYCSKRFMQKEVLKRHASMHTGIKPYPCQMCDKSFIQKKMLSIHISKVHLNSPIVEVNACHLCPKNFVHASGLSRHLQQHTGTIFTCGQCSRSFNDKSAMKRHVLAVHDHKLEKKAANISIGKSI